MSCVTPGSPFHFVFSSVKFVSDLSNIVFFFIIAGAIPWFYVAELFAQGPRSAAVSVSVLINWLANFTVGLVFPELQVSTLINSLIDSTLL
jgi:SP family facilitated glucose transporter-like MFS transporter 1